MKTKTLTSLLAVTALMLASLASGEESKATVPDETQLNQMWTALSPREKAAVLRMNQALRRMPAEERKFIHDRVERFMEMTPEERRKLKENNDRWQKMTDEEKQQAREKYRLRRKEFEEKWRKEHPGEQPPPFPYSGHRKHNLAAPKDGAEPKTQQPTQPKESQP